MHAAGLFCKFACKMFCFGRIFLFSRQPGDIPMCQFVRNDIQLQATHPTNVK